MNIFAILENGELQRLTLSQNIQNELDNFYNTSKEKFLRDKEVINFEGDYKAGENEIFRIDEFNWLGKIKHLEANHRTNVDINNPLQFSQLENDMIENIKILIIDLAHYIIFQNVDNRKFIKPRSFLIYSENTFSFEDRSGIKLDENIDAAVNKSNGELLFNSFHNASKIFDLSEYYREATDDEVQNFLNDELFEVDGPIDINNLNQNTRKKIYLIMKNRTLKNVRNNYPAVKGYAISLGLNDCFTDDKIVIKSGDKKLIKRLIDFLNEDLYKSPISGLIYVSNSKRKVNE